MAVIIKRYQNRKLYNTQSKRYVTLPEIEELIKEQQEIMVIDNLTGKDITSLTLSQVIFETRKNQTNYLPTRILTMLVQSGGKKIEEIRRDISITLNLYHQVNEEIERRVNLLIEKNDLTKEEAIRILDMLLSVNQDQDQEFDIKRRILIVLEKRQVITKKDLLAISQKIDELTLHSAELEKKIKA